MTSKPPLKNTDFVRQRRSGRGIAAAQKPKSTTSSRRSYSARTMYLPTEPRTRREPAPAYRTKQGKAQSGSRRNEYSFSLGRTDVRAPAISLPRFNLDSPRLVSGIITVALTVILILLWTASPFTVTAAEVTGNQRIEAEMISKLTGILGEPIFKAVPEQIEINLRSAYPDLSQVTVRTGLPNRIRVEVVERTPVIAWYQNGQVTWVDADGMVFAPRGEVTGLVLVTATGSPIDVEINPDVPLYEQRFINPVMVQALISLAPSVPEGMLLIYDPQYGIGWQDPRGWNVVFGENTQSLQVKLTIYQAMVDRFITQGIQPTLISLEYLDAPFYK
jgi:hypothetical protein